MGLVTRLADDPREAALALAREIAGRSPDAVRASKRLLNRTATEAAAAQFAAERAEIGRLIGSPNQAETVMAHMEKREPRFSDPA
jgi:enoyl-CoA hydratase/carnithine racemase